MDKTAESSSSAHDRFVFINPRKRLPKKAFRITVFIILLLVAWAFLWSQIIKPKNKPQQASITRTTDNFFRTTDFQSKGEEILDYGDKLLLGTVVSINKDGSTISVADQDSGKNQTVKIAKDAIIFRQPTEHNTPFVIYPFANIKPGMEVAVYGIHEENKAITALGLSVREL